VSTNYNKAGVICWSLVLTLLTGTEANAASLNLNNGTFFGPGNAVYNDTNLVGSTRFVDAQVRNIQLTGPLVGFIPFANNGAAEPNVIAERLQNGGIIDGLASDGTPINENADTALRLNFRDDITGESADVMVVAEFSSELPNGGEPIFPDELGNLTFNPSVLADPGDPAQIARFNVSFTTGVVQIPLSLKTQAHQVGGEDNAGPLNAGEYLVGRMGDFNHDGRLDGVLVLAANAPMELVVARGNPIAQIRPWDSDIPIDPISSSVLELRGVALNFSSVVEASLQINDFEGAAAHLQAARENVRSTLENMRVALQSGQLDRRTKRTIRRARAGLRHTYSRLTFSNFALEAIALSRHGRDGRYRLSRASRWLLRYVSAVLQHSFVRVGQILKRVTPLSPLGS